MSKQERVSWLSLSVSLVVAWLYFSHVLQLPPDAGLRLHSGYIVGLIVLSITLTIAGEIAFRVVMATAGREVDDSSAKDERDELIGLKATRNGHTVLSFAIIAVLAQVALIEWFAPHVGRTGRVAETLGEAIVRGPLTPAILWQLLLAAMTLASIAIYASRIVYYRRGA